MYIAVYYQFNLLIYILKSTLATVDAEQRWVAALSASVLSIPPPPGIIAAAVRSFRSSTDLSFDPLS